MFAMPHLETEKTVEAFELAKKKAAEIVRKAANGTVDQLVINDEIKKATDEGIDPELLKSQIESLLFLGNVDPDID